MITNIRTIVTPDLLVENDSFLLDRVRAGKLADLPQMGALTFISSETESESLEQRAIACGVKAVSIVRAIYRDQYKLWLFVADSWRPINRISKHIKLWRSIKNSIDCETALSFSDEVPFESDGKIRYAGLLLISDRSLANAINTVRLNSSCFLFFSNRQDVDTPDGVQLLYKMAFRGALDIGNTSIDYHSLIAQLCAIGDICVRATGLFDDRDAAVDLFGPANVIRNLVNKHQQQASD